MLIAGWTRALAAAIAVAGLSACRPADGDGNGLFAGPPAGSAALGGTVGSGTGSSTPKVPFSGTGQGRSEGISIPDANNISVSDRSSAGGVNATVTVNAGAVSYQDANVFIPDIVDATPATGVGAADGYISGNSLIDVISGGGGGTLEHLAFGYVTNQTGSAINLAGFHAGDIEGLPTTPTARYVGTFIGQYYEIGSNQSADYVGSIMSLNADFTTGKVTADIPVILQEGGRGGSLDFTGYNLAVDANIVGSKFSGTASYVDGGSTVGSVTASSVNGAFYGALGQEVAGAVRIEGRPRGTDTVIVGGFGASEF